MAEHIPFGFVGEQIQAEFDVVVLVDFVALSVLLVAVEQILGSVVAVVVVEHIPFDFDEIDGECIPAAFVFAVLVEFVAVSVVFVVQHIPAVFVSVVLVEFVVASGVFVGQHIPVLVVAAVVVVVYIPLVVVDFVEEQILADFDAVVWVEFAAASAMIVGKHILGVVVAVVVVEHIPFEFVAVQIPGELFVVVVLVESAATFEVVVVVAAAAFAKVLHVAEQTPLEDFAGQQIPAGFVEFVVAAVFAMAQVVVAAAAVEHIHADFDPTA